MSPRATSIVAGLPVPGADRLADRNPSNLDDVVCEVELSGPDVPTTRYGQRSRPCLDGRGRLWQRAEVPDRAARSAGTRR